MRSFLIMLSAVRTNVQQTFDFAGNTGLTIDRDESEEHDYVVVLSEVH